MQDPNETEYILPGKAESYWVATTPESDYSTLQGDIRVDVAIIGGGIAGITSAFLLKEAGVSVAVIEADRILRGTTGYRLQKLLPSTASSMTASYRSLEEGQQSNMLTPTRQQLIGLNI